MKHFAALFAALDRTNKTSDKVKRLAEYFRRAAPADAAWAVYLLSGRRVKSLIPVRKLCEWASEHSGVPAWLFEECYESVGDLAETISLILPPSGGGLELPLHQWLEHCLEPLRGAEESVQRAAMVRFWREAPGEQRLLLHKLMTGAFRVGVSQGLVVRALAEVSGVAPDVLQHRLMGDWRPDADFYQRLVDRDADDGRQGQPYPFLLAHPLSGPPQDLGETRRWQAEWKWDGIRAQLIRRRGEVWIWSRGEELMTERFPEVTAAAEALPEGTVLDGELLAWDQDVRPFSVLQKRIGRKKVGPKILRDAPVAMICFDLLEAGGRDLRREPLAHRRQALESLLQNLPPQEDREPRLRLAPVLAANCWAELQELRRGSRARHAEGLMLKRLDSPYGVGRVTGDWWKWKIEPYTVDAVLIYAQRGSGRRASLYTDYTFAVWDQGELTPFAKAYSGLTNDEIQEVDAFVRSHTLERFGPVRAVRPELVFEIAFENVQASSRHKSGLAVRFPRIQRWRRDKPPDQADSLQTLRDLILEPPPG